MMMARSSSNGCSTSEDKETTEEEGGYSTPKGGATDTAEASCNKKSSQDAPYGAVVNENTDSMNMTCREMITRLVEISRHR